MNRFIGVKLLASLSCLGVIGTLPAISKDRALSKTTEYGRIESTVKVTGSGQVCNKLICDPANNGCSAFNNKLSYKYLGPFYQCEAGGVSEATCSDTLGPKTCYNQTVWTLGACGGNGTPGNSPTVMYCAVGP